MEAKRDLFDELVEGFDALKDQREAQRTLRMLQAEAAPPIVEGAQDAAASEDGTDCEYSKLNVEAGN